MANLSQNDRNIIAEHPLNKCLDHLQDPLRKAEQNFRPGSLSYDGTVDSLDSGPQKAISRLLSTLQGHEVALDLGSKIGNSNVATELSKTFGLVQSGRYSYEHYRTLSRLVIKQAPDVDIWNAVFDLIIIVSRTTPSTSIPVSFDSTPVIHSSASQQGKEQTRKLVEGRIFEEIKSCTYRNVGGFFFKYFEGKDWTERTKEVYRSVQDRYAGGKWTDFPDPPVQDDVLEWLFDFQKEFLSDAQGVYYTTKSIQPRVAKTLPVLKPDAKLISLLNGKATRPDRHTTGKTFKLLASSRHQTTKTLNPYCSNLAGTCVMCSLSSRPAASFTDFSFMGLPWNCGCSIALVPTAQASSISTRNRSSLSKSLQGTP